MITLDDIISENIIKIVFSKPEDKKRGIKKLSGRMISAKNKVKYQYEYILNNKAFHENIEPDDNKAYILKKLGEFRQADVWCSPPRGYETGRHYIVYGGEELKIHKAKDSLTRGGGAVHVSVQTHDKEKNFIIREGDKVPILTELGVFTHDYKLKIGMNAKFRQINRFCELVDDVISREGNAGKKYPPGREINIIDFGCGKSYLTFVLYYYFNVIKKLNAKITGVDLKSDVIEYCNKLALEYGYDGLKFIAGDIKDFYTDSPVDIIVSLHGCDVATDYAVYNGIKWNAGLMFIAPCCQHEANETIQNDILSEMFRYGVLKERFSALLTDSIRCSLTEANNYKVDLIEFVGFSHTPKNLLIRAEKTVRPNNYNEKIIGKVQKTLADFSINHKLYDLLYK